MMTPNTAMTKRVLVLMITIMNMTVKTIATTTTTTTMARLVPTMMTPDDGDDVNGDDNVENRVTNVDLQQFAAQGPFPQDLSAHKPHQTSPTLQNHRRHQRLRVLS